MQHLRASIDEDRRTIQKDTTLIRKVQVQLLNDKKVIEQKVKEVSLFNSKPVVSVDTGVDFRHEPNRQWSGRIDSHHAKNILLL